LLELLHPQYCSLQNVTYHIYNYKQFRFKFIRVLFILRAFAIARAPSSPILQSKKG
jgi:hypothetical protein